MSALAALQAALAVEHQVVYGYGVVAAHLSGPREGRALRRLAAHQELRDEITALVRALGAEPVVASPAYAVPLAVHDARSAATLAGLLEDGSAGGAWDVVATSAPSSAARKLATASLAAAAAAAAIWRRDVPGSTDPALPGQPPASQPSTTPTSSPSESTTASGSTS